MPLQEVTVYHVEKFLCNKNEIRGSFLDADHAEWFAHTIGGTMRPTSMVRDEFGKFFKLTPADIEPAAELEHDQAEDCAKFLAARDIVRQNLPEIIEKMRVTIGDNFRVKRMVMKALSHEFPVIC